MAFDGWRHLAYGNGGYGHDALGLADELETLELSVLEPILGNLQSSKGVLAIAGQWPSELEDRLAEVILPPATTDASVVRRSRIRHLGDRNCLLLVLGTAVEIKVVSVSIES